MDAKGSYILYIIVALLVLLCWMCFRRRTDDGSTPDTVRDEFRAVRELEQQSQRQVDNAQQSAKDIQREINESRTEVTTVADGINDVASDLVRGAIIARESRELVKQIRERLSAERKKD